MGGMPISIRFHEWWKTKHTHRNGPLARSTASTKTGCALAILAMMVLSATVGADDSNKWTGEPSYNVQAYQPTVTLEPDTDRPGKNLRVFDLESPDPALCAKACGSEANCRAYTYVKPGVQGPKARCWLKTGVPSAKPSPCCVSGVKTDQGGGSSPAKVPVFEGRPISEPPGVPPSRVPGVFTPREKEPGKHQGPVTTKKDACNKYANEAVLQYKALMKLSGQCGISGPQWNPDFSYHFNRCMSGGNISRMEKENKDRQAALLKCKKRNCESYAKVAIFTYNEVKSRGCIYTGPQWSPDYNYHYSWCMTGNNILFSEAEESARYVKYKECICKNYSNTAISDNQENKKKGCGFTGPAWSSDYNAHFNYCMNAMSDTPNVQDARYNSLLQCETCRRYAEVAVSQNEKNKQKGCNFSGPQWSSNYNSHFSWCMTGKNSEIASKEENARQEALFYKCTSMTPSPPPPSQATTKTTIINGFKQVTYTKKTYYVAKIQIANGKLISVKNRDLGLGKQWTVMILKPGVSSEDCGKAGKTINISPGSSNTDLKGTSLYNLILGFCLGTSDPMTYNQGLPPYWALEITHDQ